MTTHKLLDILGKLCNMFIEDGQVHEEVIEMLIDVGADLDVLRSVGFTDSQIDDYIYYESAISGLSEDEIRRELYQQGDQLT